MKLLASLALILSVPALAQEPPAGDGPRGSSQLAPGERRLDIVGRASVGEALSVPDVSVGEFVEITALDSGKTIVATVTAPSGVDGVTLSPAAADLLKVTTDGGAVRVRRAVVTPQEDAALRQGETLSRIDAPAALRKGLHKRLPPSATAAVPDTAPKPRPLPVAKPTPPKPMPQPAVTQRRGNLWVQVASLSNAANARALAAKLGGSVSPLGALHRVRIGPIADRPAAERARARAVAAGYRDAAIVKSD